MSIVPGYTVLDVFFRSSGARAAGLCDGPPHRAQIKRVSAETGTEGRLRVGIAIGLSDGCDQTSLNRG